MPSEQDAAQAYCREGGRVITAKPADVRALEAAAQPRYAQLEHDPQTRDIIAQIRALAQHVTNSNIEDAPTCAPSRGDAGPAPRAQESGIPNGVYRNHITIEEMLAAGINEATATDNAKLEAFLGQVISETGAAGNAALVVIGDKLGLYRTMAAAGPLTSSELAQRTGTAERYVREWLHAQAAGGYIDYDEAPGQCSCFTTIHRL
jgi:hypothetical protein